MPVRGDNSKALASGLLFIQVTNHGITVLYPLSSVYCRSCSVCEILHAKFWDKVARVIHCISGF